MLIKSAATGAFLILATTANAVPVVVTFTGQWWAQANTEIGGTQQVTLSVPKDFQIKMTIDPDINTFDTFAINANYMTRFPSVLVESAITQFGLSNPFEPPYAGGSYATVSRYSASYAPYKIESQNIGLRSLSGTTFADGGSGQWEMKLWISSPNIPVSIIRPINSADLMTSFATAITEQRQYNIYYEKSATVYNTSAATGYPYTGYIGGISLNGYAQITSVTAVPEPSTALSLLAGIALLGAGYRYRLRTHVASKGQYSRQPHASNSDA